MVRYMALDVSDRCRVPAHRPSTPPPSPSAKFLGEIYDRIRRDKFIVIVSDRVPGLAGAAAPVFETRHQQPITLQARPVVCRAA